MLFPSFTPCLFLILPIFFFFYSFHNISVLLFLRLFYFLLRFFFSCLSFIYSFHFFLFLILLSLALFLSFFYFPTFFLHSCFFFILPPPHLLSSLIFSALPSSLPSLYLSFIPLLCCSFLSPSFLLWLISSFVIHSFFGLFSFFPLF